MDIRDIKSLIKVVVETDITEFEIETAESKIKIQRGSRSVPVSSLAVPQVVAHHPVAAPVLSEPALQSSVSPVENVSAPEAGTAITSPIVGTLYRSPSPDAASYVEAGQVVEKGQILCIVEAMKLMNEIEAEYRCKILKICKENAQPVEYGETLFLVEPL